MLKTNLNLILVQSICILAFTTAQANQGNTCSALFLNVEIEQLRSSHSVDIGIEKALARVNIFAPLRVAASVSPKYLRQLWRVNSFFRSEEYYNVLGPNAESVENFFMGWYIKNKNNAQITEQTFQKFKNQLPLQYLSLILDPGIAIRADDFLNFAQGFLKQFPHISLMELRRAYSAKLGTKIFYRGMTLSKQEADDFVHRGMASRSIMLSHYTAETYDYSPITGLPLNRLDKELDHLGFFIAQGPILEMYLRITEGGRNYLSLSITDYPEVAYQLTKRFGDKGKSIFVFKLEIPLIDVVPALLVTDEFGHAKFKALNKFFYMDQQGVESFVTGSIPAEQVIEYKEYLN